MTHKRGHRTRRTRRRGPIKGGLEAPPALVKRAKEDATTDVLNVLFPYKSSSDYNERKTIELNKDSAAQAAELLIPLLETQKEAQGFSAMFKLGKGNASTGETIQMLNDLRDTGKYTDSEGNLSRLYGKVHSALSKEAQNRAAQNAAFGGRRKSTRMRKGGDYDRCREIWSGDDEADAAAKAKCKAEEDAREAAKLAASKPQGAELEALKARRGELVQANPALASPKKGGKSRRRKSIRKATRRRKH
jgi:hypothetical protein